MQYGQRIIYDAETGAVLNGCLCELNGAFDAGLRPIKIDFIDLPYGDTTLQDADKYHVDITTKKIVIDTTKQHVPTQDELMQAYLQSQGVI